MICQRPITKKNLFKANRVFMKISQITQAKITYLKIH